MEALVKLDEVAYIRYASVYRRFRDAGQFMNEVERLRKRMIHQDTLIEEFWRKNLDQILPSNDDDQITQNIKCSLSVYFKNSGKSFLLEFRFKYIFIIFVFFNWV